MKDSQFFSTILLIAFCVLAVPALGISWDISQLTDDDWDDSAARINSDGDVAWLKDFGPGGIDKQRDVFLYDQQSGETIRLTATTYDKFHVQIVENGDVVWAAYDGPGEDADAEIYRYQRDRGVVVQYTDNNGNDFYPKVNALGDMAWFGEDGTTRNDTEIYYYDYSMGYLAQITGATEEGTDEEQG